MAGAVCVRSEEHDACNAGVVGWKLTVVLCFLALMVGMLFGYRAYAYLRPPPHPCTLR